jgi:NADP-reducing hydrogenase subunit HndB
MSTLLGLVGEKGSEDIIVTTSGCAGLCSKEPMMTVELKGKAPVKYIELNEEKTRKIFSEHVLSNKVVEEYALAIGSERVG